MTERRQPAGHPANSTKYKKLRAAFMKAQGPVAACALCGELVNMALSGRAREGPSVDHIVPPTAGGSFFDVSNWQLAHRRCNARKGRGEAIGPAPRSGSPRPRPNYPAPPDPGWCWTVDSDGYWMHILPMHGEPDHWNCRWEGCRHGAAK